MPSTKDGLPPSALLVFNPNVYRYPIGPQLILPPPVVMIASPLDRMFSSATLGSLAPVQAPFDPGRAGALVRAP